MATACVVSAMSTSGRCSRPNINMTMAASAGAIRRQRFSRNANQASASKPTSRVQPESSGLPVQPALHPATRTATSTMRSMPQPMMERNGASAPNGIARTAMRPNGMITRLTKGKARTLPITPRGAVWWKW
ncbi:hypothetical protein D3C87_1488570 [compost metagenome]